MSPNELAHWRRVTSSSETKWVQDEIRWHNRHEIFAYKGGDSGVYLCIEADGTASAGTYEGAYPHIMEAVFHETFRKKFINQDEAFARIAERLGASFILNLLTSIPVS